jgi:hypothetical protein
MEEFPLFNKMTHAPATPEQLARWTDLHLSWNASLLERSTCTIGPTIPGSQSGRCGVRLQSRARRPVAKTNTQLIDITGQVMYETTMKAAGGVGGGDAAESVLLVHIGS